MSVSRLRTSISVLLIVSAVLFAIGATVERNQRHNEGNDEAAASTEVAHGDEVAARPGTDQAGSETILGVDPESTSLTVVALVAALLLGVGCRLTRSRRLAAAIVGFGLFFAAADGRELAHQVNESNAGIAVIAAVLLLLHAAIAVLAVILVRRGSTSEPAVAPAA